MGGDLSGRNGSGAEKYFPAEREAMEKARKEQCEKEKEIRADERKRCAKGIKQLEAEIESFKRVIADQQERFHTLQIKNDKLECEMNRLESKKPALVLTSEKEFVESLTRVASKGFKLGKKSKKDKNVVDAIEYFNVLTKKMWNSIVDLQARVKELEH